jgi:hypothetical protein
MKMNRNEVLEWLESIQENYAMQDETQEVAQALLQAIEDVKAMDKLEQIVKSTTTRLAYDRKFEEVKQIVNNAMQKEEEPEEVEVTSCVGCIHSKESEPTAYNCATCEKFSNYDSAENYKE